MGDRLDGQQEAAELCRPISTDLRSRALRRYITRPCLLSRQIHPRLPIVCDSVSRRQESLLKGFYLRGLIESASVVSVHCAGGPFPMALGVWDTPFWWPVSLLELVEPV